MKIETILELENLVESENIGNLLTEAEQAEVANEVWSSWDDDRMSRRDWEVRNANALALALQIVEEKTFPWAKSSNVKFPLITIAALQFHAKAYPGMLPGPDIVKCRVYGPDPDGIKAGRAQRVESHMSYQILEEDEAWEDNHDRVLITVPIVGTAFKKSYYDPSVMHNVSENILTRDVYIPYFAKSVEKASRITQVLYLSSNEILEKVRRGIYTEHDVFTAPRTEEFDPLSDVKKESQGILPPSNDSSQPFELLEQHRWLDLDGDGYEEPYIVTIRKDTKQLLRIVARYTMKDVTFNRKKQVMYIKATNYFTKYPFIPSPDGGIYDLGFGSLLGPLNESINTIVNQLIDAGTLANTAGGFLGRGAKFRSGDNSFKPFEWKRVDSTGDDLRKSIVPLATKDPSQVLFSLLELLINYGERIAGATDPQVGVNPGQNTPAETSRNTLMEGQRIFVGIFKRLHRAMKEEFRKLYMLNQLYLAESSKYYTNASGLSGMILRDDYSESEKSICPASDPNMVTDGQKMTQVMMLKQAAASVPGYDPEAVERRFLEAIKIPDIANVYPGMKAFPPQPSEKLQIENMRMQQKMQEMEAAQRMVALELLGEAELIQAKVQQLHAETAKAYAEAKGVESGHNIAIIQSQIAAAKQQQTALLQAARLIQDSLKTGGSANDSTIGAGVQGMAGAPGDSGVPGISQEAGEAIGGGMA